ncbi:hypothetical protein BEP19_16330 [Ammoniphilus oxalaticus]|uniref:DUF3939 domain-containing protein n=1 Tax=Ammoniphilus oxalaticus TaxID=66863 RepID=A0A419SQK6_9BACL|nr:DUF3939 domain-containing protein [Ammoniphilus oxalaticus]RKD26766.1 hypothetical protein BEP19_16330 [Ammoniphilus oxalaticus]
MLKRFKRWLAPSSKQAEIEQPHQKWPLKEISIEEVKGAVARFAKEKADGIYLSVLIKENLALDYDLLAPYLKAIPKDPYYMSRETYEIFDEATTPHMIDQIQKAVDRYIDIEEKFPIEEGNANLKICYYKLRPYLKESPSFDTYLTTEENLITRKRPRQI